MHILGAEMAVTLYLQNTQDINHMFAGHSSRQSTSLGNQMLQDTPTRR